MADTKDEKYMRLCFELARKGAGYVSPNPLVGAVIVMDDKIISTGYHTGYGAAHAERNAIDNAVEALAGATLYCNLEPCVHTDKQTPPCVPAIIACGIKKLVISNTDTNPKVNGKGIRILEEAGVEVITNVLEDEGGDLNRFYFKFMETGFPYVTVKIAASLDGKISAAKGTQTWLTGKESQKFVHAQRSIYDAVLVGANTVNIDDPRLTVRDIDGRNPIRIILDGNLSSGIDSIIFNDKENRTVVLCSATADKKKKRNFAERGIELIEFETGEDNKINLREVIGKLSELKITSLFVEGGGKIFDQFISQHLCDEVIIIKAPITLNSGIETISLDNAEDFYVSAKKRLGEDFLFIYKPKTAKHVYRNN